MSARSPEPRFSLIVAVHNVQGYVRECIDSITAQSFPDFEVIAVDDASTDHSGAILDDLAAADDRVRVVHLEENVGLGEARNVGLGEATGEYVLFVDGDDWLDPDLLDVLDLRVEKAQRPDVVVFEYTRVFWDGRRRRNLDFELFEQERPLRFTLDDHPEFLQILQVVWNKAYRRQFVEDHGFRFPPGYYEDTPWTYPVLVTAGSISVLPYVGYLYRQRRHGNILQTAGRRHFDIFEQWDRVWTYMDAHPELERWRAPLFDRMVNHFLTILRLGGSRVPRRHHREFFTLASAHYRKYRPAGYRAPTGLRRLRQPLFLRNVHPLFHLIERVRSLGRHLRPQRLYRVARRTVWFARKVLYRLMLVRFPVDDRLAVFAAYWYRGYACNPRAVHKKLQELAPDVKTVWIVNAQFAHTMPKGVDYCTENSLRYFWVLARAKYLVNNVNFPSFVVKRRKTVELQTQHGTPLKTMGLDLVERPVAAAEMDFEGLLERCDRWDYLLSSNPLTTEVWSRVYPARYQLLEYGYPRNDVFTTHDPGAPARAKEKLGVPPGRTTILYAPTHREYRPRFDVELDLARVARALGDEYLLLVRAHYFYDDDQRLRHLEERGLVLDVSEHPDLEELCLASDILLTDYSSLMFDYANLGRPIVVYANDWDTYRRVRGVNVDVVEEGPGPVATTEDELVEILRTRAFESEDAVHRLKRFQERFCEFDDGNAAERVVRHVFLGQT